MNGKKARALRRIHDGVPTDADRLIYARHGRRHAAMAAVAPKPLEVRARKPKKPIAPTWPRTDDQRAQSRPVIVVRPVRAMCVGKTNERKAEIRMACQGEPKHVLDAAYLSGTFL